MPRRSGAPVASSLRYQQRTQAVRRLAPQAPLKYVEKVLTGQDAAQIAQVRCLVLSRLMLAHLDVGRDLAATIDMGSSR